MKTIFVVFAVTATVFAGPSAAQIPPKGKEITMPSAAGGPGIEELSRSPVSLLTFGLARLEARLDRLEQKHEADFFVSYDAEAGRIHISVTSRKMKATEENCERLIGIVREDANLAFSFDDNQATFYAYFFANAGEGPANIDSRIDIEATVDNSYNTNALTFTDRKTCTGGIKLP